MATSIDELMELAKAYGWAAADHEHHQSDDTLDAMEMAEQELRAGLVALSAAPAAPQPAQAVPDGWKLVPVAALKRWRDAFADKSSALDINHRVQTNHYEIVALLSAAPAAPQPARCPQCNYQHGHQIGCGNNPVDIALKAQGSKDRP